jgi:hypothetical protein
VNRLRLGEWVAAAGAVGLFVVLFFDWLGVSVDHAPPRNAADPILIGYGLSPGSLSGWSNLGWFMDVLLCVAIIGGLSLSYMTVKRTSPAWPIGAGVLTVALGAVIALVLALRLLDLANDESLDHGDKLVVAVQLPAYLGLLLAILIPVGGFLSLRDERTDSPEARDYVQPPARTVPGT